MERPWKTCIRRALAGLLLVVLAAAAQQPARADFKAGAQAYAAGDLATALLEWTKVAQDGDARAQWLVGNMYALGEGTGRPDANTAAVFYRQAAEQGFTEAQLSLAALYRLPNALEADYEQALAWLYRAASKNHPVAQAELGGLFRDGVEDVLPPDPVQALEWYSLAAGQGVLSAQIEVALIHLEGKGVPKNEMLGFAWLIKARTAARANQESIWSRRVMALSEPALSAPEGMSLSDLIARTYAAYARLLPERTRREAQTEAARLAP